MQIKFKKGKWLFVDFKEDNSLCQFGLEIKKEITHAATWVRTMDFDCKI